MITEELNEIAEAAAKNIKTEQDLDEFRQMLTKITVEAALNAELDDHLGYERHEKASRGRPGDTHFSLIPTHTNESPVFPGAIQQH